ncbi:tyrosine-type recombinase/integrase (plasmid) [Cupriavidus pauculus]|uniref:Tyrosine-type recombinase/integrase n=1 Tax=Cupriavidus pauculus TaxID=82633 RepID=A0A5P2H8U0_9BURK|nr:tyrosine-type recombinase/integrase [Cupriavidus pauculus]
MYWRVRYTLDGKEKLTQVGVYRKKGTERVTMRLSKARERRDELRDLLSRGLDPSARAARGVRWPLWLKSGLRRTASAGPCSTHTRTGSRYGTNHVLPIIGAKPMRTIGTAGILTVLQKMLAEGKAETARRVRQRLAGVFQFAVLREYIDRDPVPLVAKEFTELRAQALKINPTESFACISREELPALLRVMSAYPGIVVRIALRLTMLTLARTKEIRGATWAEFHDVDGDAPIWRIPAARMKANRAHDVPLSRQAVEVLKELRGYTGDSEYLFPHERKGDRSMSESAMLYALWSMGYRGRMTGHGFRALGSTILNEAGYCTRGD